MATFGTLPGVQVTATGGAVTGVTVGRAQYLVLIGHGDNSAGSASTNTPVDIQSRSDADTQFGSGTDIARAYRDARANGANSNFIYGVMANNTQASETFSATASGTLSNAPIVDELADVTVGEETGTDGTYDDTILTVNFVYDSTVPTPSDADTMNINPITGEWAADSSGDYEVTYKYSDWSSAITAAEDVIGEDEFGLLTPLSNAESVANTLTTSLDSLRNKYRMALGLMAAEPNATTTDYKPKYDTANYSDALDNDALFLVAPVTEDTSDTNILGAAGGLFAGNDVTNPVYNDPIEGTDSLDQKLSKAEADDLRNAQVIPIRDSGGVRVRANLSTSTATDWERDYWRRRIVDLSIITAKSVSDSILGLINDPDTRSSAQTMISTEMDDLVELGLLQPNQVGDTNIYTDVYKVDADTIGVDLGITPYGVVKNIEISLQINA